MYTLESWYKWNFGQWNKRLESDKLEDIRQFVKDNDIKEYRILKDGQEIEKHGACLVGRGY